MAIVARLEPQSFNAASSSLKANPRPIARPMIKSYEMGVCSMTAQRFADHAWFLETEEPHGREVGWIGNCE